MAELLNAYEFKIDSIKLIPADGGKFEVIVDDKLVYCSWFAGGLRIVDISDPTQPKESGFFIPTAPQGVTASLHRVL